MGSVLPATAAAFAANKLLSNLTTGIFQFGVSKDKKDAALVKELLTDSLKKGDIAANKVDPISKLSPLFEGVSNAAFVPDLKRVFSSDDLKDLPAVMAHELGHASNFASNNWFRKLTQKLYTPGCLAPTAAMITNMLGHNKLTTGQQMGINALSSLLYSPVLIEEFSASNKGRKMLQGKGKSFLEALPAFSGVPSYIAAGLAPYVQTGAQALFGVNKKASVAGLRRAARFL